VLSHLALSGNPAICDPQFRTHQQHYDDYADRHCGDAGARDRRLIVSFVPARPCDGDVPLIRSTNTCPTIRLLMAVPVVSWILFAVLWFRASNSASVSCWWYSRASIFIDI
jgi:hypothetical protein